MSLLEKLDAQSVVTISEEEFRILFEVGKIVRETDTGLSGIIRIFRIDDIFAVQEKTNWGLRVIRKMKSRKAADSFVDDRLATYERMWDGCGCKIDYFAS